MQLPGKSESKKQQRIHKQVIFFLDECLPYQMAYYLESIGHPITSWHKEFQGQQGYKETPLIQYLGAKGYTWITKDDEAKKEHESDIRTSGICVVWVRGLERRGARPAKKGIRMKDVNRMLVDKLDSIEEQIATAKSRLYFLLYMKSGGQPALNKITLEDFFGKLPKN